MYVHFRYFKYLARHKWFVFVAGRKTKAPLWRLLIHDWSKFMPIEWNAYAHKFYGPRKTLAVDAAFDAAWLHHQHRNPHHWQHWVLRNDDGTTKALPMPSHFIREMVADWMGAGRTITGKWGAADWYIANQEKISLHVDTKPQVVKLLGII